MPSCRALWPEMDWESGREWQATPTRSCRAFWPELDRQWPAMHFGVLQWTEMAMDSESRFCRQWPALGSGYELLDEARRASACCQRRVSEPRQTPVS